MIGEAFIVSGQMPQLTELCRLCERKYRWDTRGPLGHQAPALTIASPRKVVRSARWMNSLVEGDSLKVTMREEAMQAGCAPECTLKLDRTVMLVQRC